MLLSWPQRSLLHLETHVRVAFSDTCSSFCDVARSNLWRQHTAAWKLHMHIYPRVKNKTAAHAYQMSNEQTNKMWCALSLKILSVNTAIIKHIFQNHITEGLAKGSLDDSSTSTQTQKNKITKHTNCSSLVEDSAPTFCCLQNVARHVHSNKSCNKQQQPKQVR